MANRILFDKDMTYDEWSAQQDHTSFEFQAIGRGHRSFPGYNLEEIKKEIFTNFIITEENQETSQETFGDRHPNSKKLNEQLKKLTDIIFSSSLGEFKSVDRRGHGDTVSARFGGRGKEAEIVAFRIEEKAIRYAHYLIEHNMAGNAQTVSDLVRIGFVKYIEMLPIIKEFKDAFTDRFLISMQKERELLDRMEVDKTLTVFEQSLEMQEKDLMDALRHIDNKEEIEEIRDWTVNFIKDALSYSCPTKKEKARVREHIMKNSKLYNILTTLERKKLITREYIDNVCQKGIVSPIFSVIPNEDTKLNGQY